MNEVDNGSIKIVKNSWQFYEFCKKEAHGKEESREEREKRIPAFYRKEMSSVKKLKEASEECQRVCLGFIQDIWHEDKVYSLTINELDGRGEILTFPNELFALGRYKPKKGDRISFVEDKKGNISFSIREDGYDKEIFSINKDSEEYKSIMLDAEKRASSAYDKLSSKERLLNRMSKGLSGEEKDKARLKAQRINAIIEDRLY